jgi:hypothetical protein
MTRGARPLSPVEAGVDTRNPSLAEGKAGVPVYNGPFIGEV